MGMLIALPLLLIGMVFVLFERKLRVAREWLLKGCHHLLAKSQQSGNDEYTVVKFVIACLVILLFVVGLLDGEKVNLALLLPHINGTGSGASGTEIDQGSLLLYLFVPAFLGMLWCEFRDMPIFGLRLFPKMNEKTKKWLRILTLCALILACVVFVCLWLYRALVLVHPEALNNPTQDITGLPFGLSFSLSDVQIFLFMTMAIVAFYTLIFALVGLKVGLIGLSVLLLGVLIVVSAVLEFFPNHVLSQLLSYICLFLTGGRLTPYMELADIKKECELLAEEKEAKKGTVRAYPKRPGGGKPGNTVKVHSFLFAGDLGSDLFPSFAADVAELHAQDTILTSGVINPAKIEAELLTLPGTRSLSPTPDDLQHAYDTAPQVGDTEAHVYRTLFNLKVKALIDMHKKKGLQYVPAAFFFVLDKRVLCHVEESLRTVHKEFPAAQLVVITAVTAEDQEDKQIQRGLELLQTLKRDGVLATTLVFDPLNSPFCQNGQDKPTLYRFFSHAIVSLLVAKKHYWDNLAITEVLKRLSQRSAFSTVSMASAPVPAGALPDRYGMTKVWPGRRAEKGVGDEDLTIQTLKELIKRIYDPQDSQHDSTRSLPVPVHENVPSFLILNVPVAQPEVEKLEKVRRELDYFTGTKFPRATVLLSRCQGVPYGDKPPASYLVGVSCFYSIDQDDFSVEQTVEAGEGSMALPEPQRGVNRQANEEREEEEEPSLAPFTIEGEGIGQRGNGTGNGQGARGKGTGKSAKREKPYAAKRGQWKQANEGKRDTAQEPSTAKKRGPGRPPKQPVEGS